MGKIQNHLPVKLFTAITYKPEFDHRVLYPILENKFSSIETTSLPYEFSSFTGYYKDEMGENLKKLFVIFKELIDPAELASIKISANLIESDYVDDDKRMINIDPGYLTQAKLVLATTKNYSHRVYLGKGIFGDVHMHYQRGQYRPNPWTYPDYRAESNVKFFGKIREQYLQHLGSIKE